MGTLSCDGSHLSRSLVWTNIEDVCSLSKHFFSSDENLGDTPELKATPGAPTSNTLIQSPLKRRYHWPRTGQETDNPIKPYGHEGWDYIPRL